MKKLPLYKLVLKDDEESGVSKISLVHSPAIKVDWVAFNDEQKKMPMEFAQVSKDKQILAAPFMIPGQNIYRTDGVNEYFVTFDAETINQIAEKFNKNLLQSSFNKDHNQKKMLDGVFIKSNWIIEDKEFDMSKKWGFDLPVGTWFGLVKVEDKAVWDDYVKTGEVKGFSVELLDSDMVYEGLVEMFKNQEQELVSEVVEVVITPQQKYYMSLLKGIK